MIRFKIWQEHNGTLHELIHGSKTVEFATMPLPVSTVMESPSFTEWKNGKNSFDAHVSVYAMQRQGSNDSAIL